MQTTKLTAILLTSQTAFIFAATAASLTVTAANKLPQARPSQTIELTVAQLAPLGERDLAKIHVRDASGKEVICQAVDTDYDRYHQPDTVIFQADFSPNETKIFTVSSGAKQEFRPHQYKAFGRFVRERFDDFAWENDRIAHRTYGLGLETWEGEPLSSSTIDIWSKRTNRMVINDWYMAADYHADHGDGGDFYSAGTSRGNGGNGLWAAARLWTSRNFVNSRVLANGPIRILFELEYAPFEVDGISVAEVKRISLDAGQQLDHYISTYKVYSRPDKPAVKLTGVIGLKKAEGEKMELNTNNGWLTKWEPMEKKAGQQGLAIIVPPDQLLQQTNDALNQLIITTIPKSGISSYWSGFCWDKAGLITTQPEWNKYVNEFALGLASPIELTFSTK